MEWFVGSWIGPDEYTSEVIYTVALVGGELSVSAVDPSDGESAEIFEIAADDSNLRFRTAWRSTGRECACVLRRLSDTEAELTFTYTDRALLVRVPPNAVA
jgi:hypothetical protein